MELAGRTALLTGATGGLGRAIAEALAERGATLVLSGRKAEALEALAAELPGEGHRVLPADLAEPGAAEKLAAEAGEVDVLVANAGLPGTGRLTDFTPEELTRALRVNLEAPMLLARALEPAMLERGSGHLVFISSLSGKVGHARAPPIYNATKFGLRGFALGLRADLDPQGIGVSIVSPGLRSAKRACSPTPAPSRPPGLGTGSPRAGRRRGRQGDRARTRSRSPWRRCQQRVLAHFALASPGIAVTSARAAPPARRRPRPSRRRRIPTGQALDAVARHPPGSPRCLGWSCEQPRLLRRPFDPRGGRALLRGLPARRAAGALRRRPPALLDQGAAGERAAARGRALGRPPPTSRRSRAGTRRPSPASRSPSSRRGC